MVAAVIIIIIIIIITIIITIIIFFFCCCCFSSSFLVLILLLVLLLLLVLPGIVGCGCAYYWDPVTAPEGACGNVFPDCPGLTDAGQNYGIGFYNDHHFHYGYHIYAAAVASLYDPSWAEQWHEHIVCLVRDIANPSEADTFFPRWRHKDWYAYHFELCIAHWT